jgi:hypothetical protein
MSELRKLQASIKPLPIYQGITRELEVRRSIMLLNQGIRQGGKAYERAVYKIAHFLKDQGGCDCVYAKQVLRRWTWQTCSSSLYDREQALAIIERICYRVYYKPAKSRNVRRWDTALSEADAIEISSVQDHTLCVLYGILYRHCKEYGGSRRQFYMTYQQMSEAGAGKNRSRLKAQIKALAMLGKVEIIQTNLAPEGKMIKSPNEYRLPYCTWAVT